MNICPEGYYEAIRTEKGKVDTVWILLSEQSIPKNKTSATLLGVKTVGSQEFMTFEADFGTFLAKQKKFVPSPVVGDDDEEDYVTHLNPVTVLCDKCKLIEDSEEPALKRPKNKFKSKKSKQKSKKKSKSKTSLKCKKTPYAWKSSSIKKSPFRTLKRAKDAESKYKDGQSIGFTAISSLKSLGRIPRSDGCYVLGAKYSALKRH